MSKKTEFVMVDINITDRIGLLRYEFLKELNPGEFADIWFKAQSGEGKFDDLVDELAKKKATSPA